MLTLPEAREGGALCAKAPAERTHRTVSPATSLQANLRQVRTNIGFPLLKVPKQQLLLPGQEKADIPEHTFRVFESLGPEPKAKRLQMLPPELGGRRPRSAASC